MKFSGRTIDANLTNMRNQIFSYHVYQKFKIDFKEFFFDCVDLIIYAWTTKKTFEKYFGKIIAIMQI